MYKTYSVGMGSNQKRLGRSTLFVMSCTTGWQHRLPPINVGHWTPAVGMAGQWCKGVLPITNSICIIPKRPHYLQIRHYIQTHTEWNKIKRDQTGIERYFIMVTEKHRPIKHHASHIYLCKWTTCQKIPSKVKEKWELDLNVIIEARTWEDVYKDVYK